MRGTVLLLAAGRGERLGGEVKAFQLLAGRSLLHHAATAAASASLVDALVVAVPAGLEARAASDLASLSKPVTVVAGGETRQASCAAALLLAKSDAVAVHDAARPLCPPRLFDESLRLLDEHEAAVVAVPVADTVKVLDGRTVSRTLDRSSLVAVQTPQAFRTSVLRRAHEEAARAGAEATDDAGLVELLGVRVVVLEGCTENLKVTTPLDLLFAEALLGR